MQNEFSVVNFLDECRWDAANLKNYNLINYSHLDLTNEEKLLTHWVSYITDRQMPFEQVWEVGGFVFSDMIKNYRLDGAELLALNSPNSFFTGTAFKSRMFCPANNDLLIKRDFVSGYPVEFTSRFYPSDYVSILFTLKTLELFDKNFVNYLFSIMKLYEGQRCLPSDLIKALAYGLYLLSYDNIGQPNNVTLSQTDWVTLANVRSKKIKALLSDRISFIREGEAFFKNTKYSKRYNCKRVWCSLRDYLKSPEFSQYFLDALHNKNADNNFMSMIFSEEAKQAIELPGDVWNNNSTFRNCLFRISGTRDKDGEPFNRQLRSIFEMGKISVGYPEQFDVTFDFVPRMCERQLCDICPFKAVYEPNRIKQICVNKADMLCPISLASCGYITDCKVNNCSLRKLLAIDMT